jgi:outer membrane protein OmpA-like peptidoglycan-associated protein
MKRLRLALVPPMLLLLSACATQPTMQTDSLQRAQQAVTEAEENSAVARFAPLALRDAQETLRQAQLMAKRDAGQEAVDHYAYLAQRRAETAQAVARREMLVRSAEAAQEQRSQVLLEARERAIEQARREAQQARQESERLRQEAEQARQQAQTSEQALTEARQQLSDLEPQQTERGLVLTLDEVLFPFNSADLQAGNQRALDRLAQYLQNHPDYNILVEGHTDSVGDAGYNQRLSEQRAESVYQALMQRGIDPQRVRVVGLGENFPVADNANPAGRSENRRVEVVIAQGELPRSRQEVQQAERQGDRRVPPARDRGDQPRAAGERQQGQPRG